MGGGQPPVLLRRSKMELRLRNVNAATLKVYPLKPNGGRRGTPMTTTTENVGGEQWLVLPIDTGDLDGNPNTADDPAVYFEIETTTPVASTFPEWRARQFGAIAAVGADAATADPDGDGSSNLLEYASGTSPLDAAESAAHSTDLRRLDGLDYLTLTFVRDRAAVGCLYEVEYAFDLAAASWSRIDPLQPEHQLEVLNDAPRAGRETITMKLPHALQEHPRQFVRLRVSLA